MGRRQVVRQLVLVQPSQRFESFRPRILKKSSLELFFNVFFRAVDKNRGSNRARELRLVYFFVQCILLSVLAGCLFRCILLSSLVGSVFRHCERSVAIQLYFGDWKLVKI